MKISENNIISCVSGDCCGKNFDSLCVGDWFLYNGMFPAWKVADTVAVFANRDGKFIRAKRYSNCLSIGTFSDEFETFAEAANVSDEWHENNW